MSNSIERQYISPNCILSLQGFSDENNQEVIPVMSVLSQATCQIIGNPTVLNGGLQFIQNLLKAVSLYSQDLLSDLNHPVELNEDSHYITLQRLPDKNRHLLTWQEKKDDTDKQITIELSNIQFFDLLDTLDQLYNDKYTLPQLKDQPSPLSRRYRQRENSIVEQSTPITLGILGLALASMALFFIPNPSTVKDPYQELKPTPDNNTQMIPPTSNPEGKDSN